ncbi:MAG: hypothetical protein EOP46_06460 [Sphingobacteriaceae bacterium]|nr:MAG: hypothetical protein EOP46_06460 [Sphingobacteriaceae bacterium]
MDTLKNDIKEQSNWIVKAFAADRLKLDFTIKSFIEIDRFFNKHTINGNPKKGGRLDTNLGPVLFSLASYIGETIIKNVKGAVWVVDEDATDGELTMSVQLPGGGLIYPAQRVMKRFKNGNEDSMYVYGHHITKEYTNELFDENYWKLIAKNPWWKFW